MCKILPLVMPPVETYQDTSFVLGIILAHDHTKNAFCNNYIEWFCKDTDKIKDLRLRFANVSWEDYRRWGIAEMDLYHLKNIAQTNFINFIKERIDQDNYILLYSIDEFYLSYSPHYANRHFIHDTYIYGYEKNSFCIMAYSGRKLKMFTVPSYEILDAMYHSFSENPDTTFCTFRPYHAVSVDIDYDQIRQGLANFINENKQYNDGKAYGLRVYDILQNSLLSIINDINSNKKEIDLRVFRVLWEHKKVLSHHIKLLDSSYTNEVNKVEQLSHIVFSLSMKYSVTYNHALLYKIIDYLNQIKENETHLIRNLLHCSQNTQNENLESKSARSET